MLQRWGKLSQKIIDLIVSLGYGALSVKSHFTASSGCLFYFGICVLLFEILIAATPGPDLTLYESGRLDIIGISCSEQ